MKTKADVIREMGLEHETFDYALPQEWVNKVRELIPGHLREWVVPSFVWLYDERARLFGRPCSLSSKGNEILGWILMRPELHLNARYWQRAHE